MKIHEIFEGSNWDRFKQGFKSGYEKSEKIKKNIKYHPITKTAKNISQFAQQSLKGPKR